MRRSRRPARTGLRVALQAQEVYVAQLQHVGVRFAMHQRAGLAPVNLHGVMLEQKRPLLVCAAREDTASARTKCAPVSASRCVGIVVVGAFATGPRSRGGGRACRSPPSSRDGRNSKARAATSRAGNWNLDRDVRMAGDVTDFVPRGARRRSHSRAACRRVAGQAARIDFFAEAFSKGNNLDVSVGSAAWLAVAPWQSCSRAWRCHLSCGSASVRPLSEPGNGRMAGLAGLAPAYSEGFAAARLVPAQLPVCSVVVRQASGFQRGRAGFVWACAKRVGTIALTSSAASRNSNHPPWHRRSSRYSSNNPSTSAGRRLTKGQIKSE